MTPEKEATAYQTIIRNRRLTPIQRLILVYLNTLDADHIDGRLFEFASIMGISRSSIQVETKNLHEIGFLKREKLRDNGQMSGIRLSEFRPKG